MVISASVAIGVRPRRRGAGRKRKRDSRAAMGAPHNAPASRRHSLRSALVATERGSGLPQSGTIRSPWAWVHFFRRGDPPLSVGGYLDERDSVLEWVSPLALSTCEPRTEPSVASFLRLTRYRPPPPASIQSVRVLGIDPIKEVPLLSRIRSHLFFRQ